jgi:MFS family permease
MYYGYKLAAALWVFYGVTLGMKFGAWGYFAPEVAKELGFSATEIGLVASTVLGGTGVFTAIAGPFIARYGCRASMFLGQALGIAGITITALATPLWQFILGAVFLAASTSFGGVIPIQTLTTNWFEKYRSTVMAAVFTATPIWGAASFPFYQWTTDALGWRGAFLSINFIFPIGLTLIWLFFRNTPVDMGIEIDGGRAGIARPVRAEAESSWTERRALLSLQFWAITLGVLICTLPYLYMTTYGRLAVESVGGTREVAVAALASLTLATLAGRLVVAAADLISERIIMMAAFAVNIAGLALFALVQSGSAIYAGVFLMGAGFGLSFLLAPILLARAFGRKVFAVVEATRMALVTGLNAALTPVFGFMIDTSGTHVMPLATIGAIHVAAAAVYAIHILRHPRTGN